MKIIMSEEILVVFKDLNDYTEKQRQELITNINDYHKGYYGLVRIGYKWVHIEIRWEHLPIIEKKFKLKKNRFTKVELQKLSQYKGFKLGLEPVLCHNFIYTRFVLPSKQVSLIECCCCLEETNANNKSYFMCEHRVVCDNCFVWLKEKLCPICRGYAK